MKHELSQISILKDSVFVFSNRTSQHELITHVLNQTGAADVFISSFSITEPAVRAFINLQDDKLLNKLTCLFDVQVKRHHLKTLFFADTVIDNIYITSNHSKVVLIENDKHHISIVGSANLNVNNKIEAGALFTQKHIYNSLKKRFEEELQKSVKYNRDDFI